jgi:hypothetical protein
MKCMELRRGIRRVALGLVAATAIQAISDGASASTANGWWHGTWSCNIDGRNARMHWDVVSVTDGDCDGDVCWQSQSAEWRGYFSDSGSAWVPLTDARLASRGGMYFNHADGNRWYLARPEGNRASGWTTWQGQRYPLSCWH